jgi:hypothetical protein
MPKMKLRAIRVPDEVWVPAQEQAAEDSVSLSSVIRQALISYAKDKTPSA